MTSWPKDKTGKPVGEKLLFEGWLTSPQQEVLNHKQFKCELNNRQTNDLFDRNLAFKMPDSSKAEMWMSGGFLWARLFELTELEPPWAFLCPKCLPWLAQSGVRGLVEGGGREKRERERQRDRERRPAPNVTVAFSFIDSLENMWPCSDTWRPQQMASCGELCNKQEKAHKIKNTQTHTQKQNKNVTRFERNLPKIQTKLFFRLKFKELRSNEWILKT